MSKKIVDKKFHQQVCNALKDLKGVDICVLDVRPLTTITDYMIVVSGTSARHVRSLAKSVVEKVSMPGKGTIAIEGEREAEWILLDLHDVVVHIMQQSARNFYQLERLWGGDTEKTSSMPLNETERQA